MILASTLARNSRVSDVSSGVCPCRAVFAGYVPAWVIMALGLSLSPWGPLIDIVFPYVFEGRHNWLPSDGGFLITDY